MPVCCICEGDGVLEAAGCWYCGDHIEEAFLAVADYLARARGWDSDEVGENLRSWLNDNA